MARSSDAAFPLSLINDKSFQLRQVRRVALLSLLFVLQSTVVLGVFYYLLLGRIVEGTAPLLFASEDMAQLNEVIPAVSGVMLRWFFIMLLLNSLLTLGLAVYIMRRLGNPQLAIRRALNDIGDGDLNVRLREGDSREFGEIVTALNRALETIQSKIEEVRAQTRVVELLEERAELDADQARSALQQCHRSLDWFKPRRQNEAKLNEAEAN